MPRNWQPGTPPCTSIHNPPSGCGSAPSRHSGEVRGRDTVVVSVAVQGEATVTPGAEQQERIPE